MGLKQMALAEIERVDQDNREREAEEAAATRKRQIEAVLHMLKNVEVDPATALIDEEQGIVTVDGIRFRGGFVLGTCPRCGIETTSERVRSLYEIGEQVRNFQPHYEHVCRRAADTQEWPQETAAERLVNALRDVLSDYSGWG